MNQNVVNIKVTAKDMASNVFGGIGKSAQNMGAVVSGAVVTGFVALGSAALTAGGFALKAGSDFENMGVRLKTAMSGSEEASKKALANLQDFAAKTPLQMDEILNSFIKLKNMGLNPSNKALQSYGDTASAMGKSLNQMVEAVADAATGEFERLKEFGIRSAVEGNKVKFTFKGVTTTVGKNAKEIEDYLIKLGETNFAGGMEDQSKTLTGRLSTLTDTVTILLQKFAESSGIMDTAKQSVEGLFNLIAANEGNILAIGEAMRAFGDYIANVLVPNAVNILTAAFQFLEPFLYRLREAFSRLWVQLQPLMPTFQKVAEVIGIILGGVLLAFIGLVAESITQIANFITKTLEFGNAIKNNLGKAFDWIMGKIQPVIDAFYELKRAAMGWQAGFDPSKVNMPTPKFKGFATGGEFEVGGRGGTDRNLVAFKASKGERVTIETPQQQKQSSKGGINIVNNFTNTMINEQQLASILAYQLKIS